MTFNDWLYLILVLIPIGLGFFSVLFYLFSKGRKVEITVVLKRETAYDIFYHTTYSNGISIHYTIDCTYKNSSKIHTFSCGCSVYDEVEENESYIATIKMMEIIEIRKK